MIVIVPVLLSLIDLGGITQAAPQACAVAGPGGASWSLRWAFSTATVPAASEPKTRWVSWGAILATVLWIGASLLFTIYVANFGSYNETYGALGAVVVLLIWLWISAFIVLLGAELNAEMEHQTERDTTIGRPKPRGERGAYVADHVGEVPLRLSCRSPAGSRPTCSSLRSASAWSSPSGSGGSAHLGGAGLVVEPDQDRKMIRAERRQPLHRREAGSRC